MHRKEEEMKQKQLLKVSNSKEYQDKQSQVWQLEWKDEVHLPLGTLYVHLPWSGEVSLYLYNCVFLII